ncbi:MAG TPA: AAA family ATPase [Gemmatimonadaceae bacterium]|nr:AAA family ATPase [Gemmatimonadaceae bacterium]
MTAPPSVPYSTLAASLSAGNAVELVVSEGGTRLTATLRVPSIVDGRPVSQITAVVPSGVLDLEDLERWSAGGAAVQVLRTERNGGRAVAGVLLVAFIGVVLFVMVQQRRGTVRRFRATPADRRLTLADVGGAREAQADLRDVIAYLADPKRFQDMGAKCPKGILLVGPPGTGKTLLARAAAGEANVPVIVASGSDFTEMYVGVGASRVRGLARQARAQAPCIVFIDEFDSIGGRRGRPNRTSEEETTLNQLLVEMDGMAGSEGIVWMAATNREDMLDPAVRRPGRFDRVVEVAMPTIGDRLEILRIHAARTPLGPDVDLERLAALTVGYSGAELASLLNDAAIIAVQDGCKLITRSHIEQARDRSVLGRVRAGVVVSQSERRLIALHEAGHVVVGLVACPEDRLHKVTIEARGRSLGAAHFAPDVDRHLHSRRYLEGVIAKALGGRAAELVFLGPDAITTGAGSDLIHATAVARRMVAEFGMSAEVGLISADPSAQGGGASAQLQASIDRAVRVLIDAQAARAEALVREHAATLEAIAEALIERDVLTAEEVHEIAARFRIGVPASGEERRAAVV